MEKEFDENRKTYLEQDKQRILNKLDNVLSSMKNDPSLGYPAVIPKKGEDKIIRHILLYNRLSPPNSLRTGEFSSKNEFYAWIDNSPGRNCEISLTLSSRINVQFPDIELLSYRNFGREQLDSLKFKDLKSEITLTWRGLLSVRNMRMEIPIIISYEAKEHEDAEFYINEPIIYKGNNVEYKYEVYAKPKIIRWKVGDAVPVAITINNNKPIRPAVPDGRNRKFKIKLHNTLMSDDEYISIFVGPLIDELEGAPLQYLYGIQIKHSSLFDPFSSTWSHLLEKRGDLIQPFFEYQRYWPWALCAHPEAIPADEAHLQQLAASIDVLHEKWNQLGLANAYSAISIDPFDFDYELQKKMKRFFKKYVCDEVEETFCYSPDDGGPSNSQRKSLTCGVWPKENTILYKSGNDDTKTIRYKIHPLVPEKTPITMIFGYFSGIKHGKVPEFNDRFQKPTSLYLPNSFMYVSNTAGNKMLRILCSRKAKIDQRKCCSVSLPFPALTSFKKDRIEKDFDVVVISASPNIKLLSYPLLFEETPRLGFRKAMTYLGGIAAKTQRFCYKPLKYGKYQIRFEILGPCRMLGQCQQLGEQKEDKLTKEDKETITAPKDFQIPQPISIIVPQFDLKSLKIIPEGAGFGDVTQVINNKRFKLRIFFLGTIKGTITITPKNERFKFEPESRTFNDGDMPFGHIEATPDIDCPSPIRIMIISYMIDDDLMMWEIPSATFLQIAPNPSNQQEINEVASHNKNDTILCNIPDDICMEDGIICGSKKELGKEIMCDKYPEQCEIPIPSMDDAAKRKDDLLRKWIPYVLYTFIGLLLFTILYRNCCGNDGNAMSSLQDAMKDLRKAGNTQKQLPKDAINAQEFMSLAGFDADEVFSTNAPNPLLVAEAELSLQKMLQSMKAR